MRIVDFLDAIDADARIALGTRDSFDIRSLVGGRELHEGVTDIGPGDLLVLTIGDEQGAYDDDTAWSKVAGLPAGAWVLVLFGRPVDRIGIPRVLEQCRNVSGVVERFGPLPYRWLGSGLLLTVAPDRWPGAALQNELAITRVAVRATSERARRAEARLIRLNRRSAALEDVIEGDWKRAAEAREDLARVRRELEGALVERDALAADLERVQLELDDLRASSRYQLGSALVNALQRPATARRLPRQLKQVWRQRAAGPREPTASASARGRVQGPDSHPDERLLASFRTLPTADSTVVVALAARASVWRIGASVGLVPVAPHDTRVVLERLEPRVLLIESAAARAGETWAGLGSAIGLSHERLVIETIDECRRRGAAIVFWWTTPPSETPGLARIARRCDIVACDPEVPGLPPGQLLSAGVELASLDPRGPDHLRQGAPLYMMRANQPPPRGVLLDAVLEAGRERGLDVVVESGSRWTGAPPQRLDELPERLAMTPWAVASPFADIPDGVWPTLTLRLLASGVPVIGSRTSGPQELMPHIHQVARSKDAGDVVARTASSEIDAERCRDLLGLVRRHASFAEQLSGILQGEVAEAATEVAVASGGTDAVELVDALAQQTERPRWLISDGRLPALAVGELTALGIDVVESTPDTAEFVAAGRAVIERGADAIADLVTSSMVLGGRSIRSSDGSPAVTSTAMQDRVPADEPWWLTKETAR